MENNSLYNLLEQISLVPDSQIDSAIASKLKDIVVNKPNDLVGQMKSILDDCIKFSLASETGISMLDYAWKCAIIQRNES